MNLVLPEDDANLLPPDAGIYLCWYTQLRDLIMRHPQLATELEVCALPGGGFTGNWYLGILKGSVSLALGTSIIDILCSMHCSLGTLGVLDDVSIYWGVARDIGIEVLRCLSYLLLVLDNFLLCNLGCKSGNDDIELLVGSSCNC